MFDEDKEIFLPFCDPGALIDDDGGPLSDYNKRILLAHFTSIALQRTVISTRKLRDGMTPKSETFIATKKYIATEAVEYAELTIIEYEKALERLTKE